MSTDQKTNVFNQISIAAQIIDGSIKIDSRAEFENVLQLFPNDPTLLRAYADLLATKNTPEVAAKSYAEAADLFIDSGMTLQAIVAKSLEWKMNPPSASEPIRDFFTLTNENGYHRTPVNVFFHTLSYSALVAILYPLIKIRLPAGRMVKKVGDEEKYLFFIVSGALRATTFQRVNSGDDVVYKKSSFHLSENDFFGDIYPFEDQQMSQSYVETITESELIKIPKISLMKGSVKYPDVEEALTQLFAAQSGIEENENSMVKRMGSRQQVPVKVQMQVESSHNGNPPLALTGYSRDISIGGICVVLDPEFQDNPSLTEIVRDANVQISLPSEDFTVNVPGKVIWSRQIDCEQDTALALGMQYREMSPKSRGMLLGFANSLKVKRI
jgi:CRP-like cAMP-binding protein